MSPLDVLWWALAGLVVVVVVAVTIMLLGTIVLLRAVVGALRGQPATRRSTRVI